MLSRTSNASEFISVSQISLNDQRIAPYVMWRAFGNNASFRQDEHARAKGHDEFHLVLDDDKRRLALSVIGLKPLAQISEHGEVHAPGRLVEQDKAWPGHKGHGGIEQLLLPIAQRARLFFREMRQAKELNHLFGSATETCIRSPEQARRHRALMFLAGKNEIVAYR